MSYEPKVGDRVTDIEDVGSVPGDVLFVLGRQVVVRFDNEDEAGLYRADELTKVEPRPTVREHRIGITPSGYIPGLQTNARIVAMSIDDLTVRYRLKDRIPVVTDLDGTPLEVRS